MVMITLSGGYLQQFPEVSRLLNSASARIGLLRKEHRFVYRHPDTVMS